MHKWEYLFVDFRDYEGLRPRRVNDQELEGWETGPRMVDYFDQLGEQGWELTGYHPITMGVIDAIFKRPKPPSRE